MMLLPGEPMMNGMPASKLCNGLQEIEDALEEVERVHVRAAVLYLSLLVRALLWLATKGRVSAGHSVHAVFANRSAAWDDKGRDCACLT